jgi:hypothetical protein
MRLYSAPEVGEAGFTDYTDPNTNSGSSFYLYNYRNTSFTSLPDDLYRPTLKLKIILNQSKNTLEEISKALWQSFGSELVCFDNADMTIAYLIKPATTSLVKIAIDAGLLPKPMGVRISGVFSIIDPTKLLGFSNYDYDNGNTVGFSTYESGFNGQNWLNYSDKVA